MSSNILIQPRKTKLFYVTEPPHIPGFLLPTEKQYLSSAKMYDIINTKFD